MFRYVPGIVLVQMVAVGLFWANLGAAPTTLLLQAGLPALLVSLVTGFWFASLSRLDAEKLKAEAIAQHVQERERISREAERERAELMLQASAEQAELIQRANAEQAELMQRASVDRANLIEQATTDRERLVHKAHKDIQRHERSVSRRANLKVGLAFAATTMAGVVLLITELLTLGLITITTAGGAMGGYLFRWRQTRLVNDRAVPVPADTAIRQINPAEELQAPRQAVAESVHKETGDA